MRITCLIQSLAAGGAERQMCLLALLLKNAGNDVQLIRYYDNDFFKPLIDGKIPLVTVKWTNVFQRVAVVRKAIRESEPDIVIAYHETASLHAELAGFPRRKFGLIVSERNYDKYRKGFQFICRFILKTIFYRFSDVIVCNSYSQERFLKRKAPWLKSKLITIINCVDLEMYKPVIRNGPSDDKLRLLVLGRFAEQKNGMGLLEAISLMKKTHPDIHVQVDWYGKDFIEDRSPNSLKKSQLSNEINKRSLHNVFRLHEPSKEVVSLLQETDALCLPSFYEGCANVICEAMACGKPVLASRVGDNAMLVEEGVNGLLFSPHDPNDIARAIVAFYFLSSEKKIEFGKNSRCRAESLFSDTQFLDNYLAIINNRLEWLNNK